MLERLSQPESIANVVAFLAGTNGAWVTARRRQRGLLAVSHPMHDHPNNATP